jgi:hypothetical protein
MDELVVPHQELRMPEDVLTRLANAQAVMVWRRDKLMVQLSDAAAGGDGQRLDVIAAALATALSSIHGLEREIERERAKTTRSSTHSQKAGFRAEGERDELGPS